jgi:hypothetical protein
MSDFGNSMNSWHNRNGMWHCLKGWQPIMCKTCLLTVRESRNQCWPALYFYEEHLLQVLQNRLELSQLWVGLFKQVKKWTNFGTHINSSFKSFFNFQKCI